MKEGAKGREQERAKKREGGGRRGGGGLAVVRNSTAVRVRTGENPLNQKERKKEKEVEEENKNGEELSRTMV